MHRIFCAGLPSAMVLSVLLHKLQTPQAVLSCILLAVLIVFKRPFVTCSNKIVSFCIFWIFLRFSYWSIVGSAPKVYVRSPFCISIIIIISICFLHIVAAPNSFCGAHHPYFLYNLIADLLYHLIKTKGRNCWILFIPGITDDCKIGHSRTLTWTLYFPCGILHIKIKLLQSQWNAR